jgi:hypothetical protein
MRLLNSRFSVLFQPKLVNLPNLDEEELVGGMCGMSKICENNAAALGLHAGWHFARPGPPWQWNNHRQLSSPLVDAP